ncbi:heterokaryon incompatibility protein-domain-containing protein [Dactylonectria macrodidyma]|uniref:Heterokaryon incompatibility protein-domain-containing protein n=1 Tax=Dactylonectria macrodidyma TaxID=307937 RepID=A0A9P9DE07_9HYPO|nr:heterokaryon incompatibility protein-domain-containing protein [Dactylonectria macrodidyma]
MVSNSNLPLCGKCAALDLDPNSIQHILKEKLRPLPNLECDWKTFSHHIMDFGVDSDYSHLQPCGLCNYLLIAACGWPIEEWGDESAVIREPGRGPFGLYAIPRGPLLTFGLLGPRQTPSTTDRWQPSWKECDAFVLAIISNRTRIPCDRELHAAQEFGCLFSVAPTQQDESETASVRLIERDTISYDIIKSWVGVCVRDHTRCATLTSSSDVPEFKLLDCETLTIVNDVPDAPYVALSYVWGTGEIIGNGLPETLPEVIQDAMTVVLRLGLKYLWVDRYCILQSSTAHKMAQIYNMDNIYGNASLTIIAAAGVDPSNGLPGVGKRRQAPQHALRLGKLQLRVVQDHRQAIAKSKWATRGWTMQESCLSRRVLYFTDDEMVFACREMFCTESLDLQFQLDLDTIAPSTAIPWPVFHCRKGVTMMIEDYSKRDLTNPKDGLNAITGMFKAWVKSKSGRHQYWGIPLATHSVFATKSFLAGLFWQPDRSESPRRHKRRRGFPTWSWLSIAGPVSFGPWLADPDAGATVSVEQPDGSIVPFQSFLSNMTPDLGASEWSPAIHVQCFTFQVGCLREMTDEENVWYYLALESQEQQYLGSLEFRPDVGSDIEELASEKSFTCLSLSHLDSRSCVIVTREKEGSFERIGLLQMSATRGLGNGQPNYRERTVRSASGSLFKHIPTTNRTVRLEGTT